METRKSRHFKLLKWQLICFLLALFGFGLGYLFNLPNLGKLMVSIAVIAAITLGIMSQVNFFSKDKDTFKELEQPKKPWE